MELVAEVLDLNDNYVNENGFKFKGVLIREYHTGDVYWKDRIKMITSNLWFVNKNDPNLP